MHYIQNPSAQMNSGISKSEVHLQGLKKQVRIYELFSTAFHALSKVESWRLGSLPSSALSKSAQKLIGLLFIRRSNASFRWQTKTRIESKILPVIPMISRISIAVNDSVGWVRRKASSWTTFSKEIFYWVVLRR